MPAFSNFHPGKFSFKNLHNNHYTNASGRDLFVVIFLAISFEEEYVFPDSPVLLLFPATRCDDAGRRDRNLLSLSLVSHGSRPVVS